MGLCRGLVYMTAGAIAPWSAALWSRPIVAAALVLTAYVVTLTGVARIVGQRAGMIVPVLVAGISIVDAGVIVATGGTPALALVAAMGFIFTLALQRLVPGT